MLPVDSTEILDSATIRQMRIAYSKKEKSSCFCLDHGLIVNSSSAETEFYPAIRVTKTSYESPRSEKSHLTSSKDSHSDIQRKSSLEKPNTHAERNHLSPGHNIDEVDVERGEFEAVSTSTSGESPGKIEGIDIK